MFHLSYVPGFLKIKKKKSVNPIFNSCKRSFNTLFTKNVHFPLQNKKRIHSLFINDICYLYWNDTVFCIKENNLLDMFINNFIK